MAIVDVLKAAIRAFLGLRHQRGRPGRVEDEDALFIG
jgi:hypothetical protein